MTDLIDRIELMRQIAEFGREIPKDQVMEVIARVPTTDRPRGHWIDMADFEQCSVCRGTHLKEVDTYYGKAIWIKTDFCPNCGADMRGEDE